MVAHIIDGSLTLYPVGMQQLPILKPTPMTPPFLLPLIGKRTIMPRPHKRPSLLSLSPHLRPSTWTNTPFTVNLTAGSNQAHDILLITSALLTRPPDCLFFPSTACQRFYMIPLL